MYRTLLLLQQQAILFSFIEKKLFFNTGVFVSFTDTCFLPIKKKGQN